MSVYDEAQALMDDLRFDVGRANAAYIAQWR